MTRKNIAIIGASGYTGAELIRLLVNHPHAHIAALTGDSKAGMKLAEVYPHFAHLGLPDLVAIDAVDFSMIHVVFCCLPHGTTQTVIANLPKHVVVFDLSADFRLADTVLYAKWYGHAHQAPQLQKEAVYGLTEHAREAIRTARIIACPGCYPTSAQLPLIPLLEHKRILSTGIIIDSKSGVTGAGRSAKQANLYTELSEGIAAYGIGSHRHTPEIEQGLTIAAGEAVAVSFTPHLMPMNRGILSSIYVTMAAGETVESLRMQLQQSYAGEPFVHITNHAPSTHEVRGTNQCRIGVFAGALPQQAVIISVIDNLMKGASGQAVQNFNLKFGFPENLGLEAAALFP